MLLGAAGVLGLGVLAFALLGGDDKPPAEEKATDVDGQQKKKSKQRTLRA